MTDKPEITTKEILADLDHRINWLEKDAYGPGEAGLLPAIRARLSSCDTLLQRLQYANDRIETYKAERDALKAEVSHLKEDNGRFLVAINNLKARAEKAETSRDELEDICQDRSARLMDAEAELAAARPLLKAVMKGTEIKPLWSDNDDDVVILEAALAYRANKEAEQLKAGAEA